VVRSKFATKIKKGDLLQIFGNSWFRFLGIRRATGFVECVRQAGDGFEFRCVETGKTEVVEDGDGHVRKLQKNVNYFRSK